MTNDPDPSLERFREKAIEELSASYSRDFLNEQEFEQRVEQATGAASHEELRRLLMDLPATPSPTAPVPVGSNQLSPTVHTNVVPDEAAARESSLIAIFSGADRKGVWDPPRNLNVIALFGGSDIDLRDARIPSGGIVINVMAMFGGVTIIVPDDLNVEVSGAGIFGGFDGKNHRGSVDPATPRIKVNGIAVFGGVDVKIKRG